MQKIPIDQAKSGMQLARGIEANNETMLAEEGEVLTDASVRRLTLAGVNYVVVQGKPVPGFNMGYDCEGRLARLQFLFRNHQSDAFMTTLMAFLALHFKERL